MTTYYLSGDVTIDCFHIRSELLRRRSTSVSLLSLGRLTSRFRLLLTVRKGRLSISSSSVSSMAALSTSRLLQAMDFFFSLQCSSPLPSTERHFRFPLVVTCVSRSVEQCPAPEDVDGPEKGRLSVSRASRLFVVTMCISTTSYTAKRLSSFF